jgi:hypothetical protein
LKAKVFEMQEEGCLEKKSLLRTKKRRLWRKEGRASVPEKRLKRRWRKTRLPRSPSGDRAEVQPNLRLEHSTKEGLGRGPAVLAEPNPMEYHDSAYKVCSRQELPTKSCPQVTLGLSAGSGTLLTLFYQPDLNSTFSVSETV